MYFQYLIFSLISACTLQIVTANIEPSTRIFKQFGSKYKDFISQGVSPTILRENILSVFADLEDEVGLANYPGIYALPNLQTISLEDSGINPVCSAHVTEWLTQLVLLLKAPLWAIQMIDAYGKFPEGILSGHFAIPGDFDECIGVRATNVSGGELDDFKGKYCYTGVSIPDLPIPLEMGTCYPSSCSNDDVTKLQATLLGPFNITTVQTGCYTDDAPELTTGDISMIVILAILGFICLVGTAVDVIFNREDPSTTDKSNLGIQCLVAFSVHRNTMKWLSTKTSGGDNFGCIHGLRFLSTSWVVLAHTFQLVMTQPIWNLFAVMNDFANRWTIMPILNGTIAVDTFFAMSGLLFSFNLLKMLEKSKGRLNLPMFYLHRYLRLTPTYALLVGIMATWFTYLGNGPKWIAMENAARHCRDNWYQNLLYVNNFYENTKGDGVCHGETWYLANDMQFFIVSPILIYPLWRWKKIGLVIMGLATLASVMTPTIVHYKRELPPTMLPLSFDQGQIDFQLHSYTMPWMRIGPYMVGLWAGYLLFSLSLKKISFKLPWFAVIGGWIVSAGLAITIIFAIRPWFKADAEIPNLDAAFYAGFHRFTWGIVICWIIIACTQGYGGIINTFLSWKVFMPLGRLTFCVYLIHFQLMELFHSRVRQAVTVDAYTTTNLFFSHMVMSCFGGFICCITMESPFIALEKIIFGGAPKKQKQKPIFLGQIIPEKTGDNS